MQQSLRAATQRIGSGLVVAAAVAALLLLERTRPLRPPRRVNAAKAARNLSLGAVSLGTASLLQKAVVEPLARVVERRRWGLVQRLPQPVRVPAALLLFDYTMYVWHRLTHGVPCLWRLHRVHHVEQRMDATTGLRFHPAEMAASIPWRVTQVMLIGTGPRELAAWQRLFFVSVLFHHANLRLPQRLERLLQPFVVTPRMHAIHHAPHREETNSNWSSGLSVWDRLHGTLRRGHPPERTGLPGYSNPGDARLGAALRLPFIRQRDPWSSDNASRRTMQTAAEPFVALFARFPTPGVVKTRLIPALGPEGAARLHRQLVERTVATIRSAGLHLELWTTGADACSFQEWLGNDVVLVDQGPGDLGARMERAAARAPMILVGSDIPDLAPTDLRAAVDALHSGAVAVGPAEDGGYYLLAPDQPCPFLFTDMGWGSDAVLQCTIDRLTQRGRPFRLLRALADLDRPQDLDRWPWLREC